MPRPVRTDTGRPMTPGVRAILGLWLGGLLLATLLLVLRGELITDLRGFTPDLGDTAGIPLDPGAGPAGRMLLLAVEGGSAEQRAVASDALVDALRADPAVARVRNGRPELDDRALEFVLAHRYLLSPRVTPGQFTTEALSAHLGERREDLSSAVPRMPRELIARDPTAESLAVLEQLTAQAVAGRGAHGVWVSADGGRALLLVQTIAEGMDLDAQAGLLERLRDQFRALEAEQAVAEGSLGLRIGGPAAIAVAARDGIRGEVTRFSLLASLALAALLLGVFRSPHPVWLAALPLGSAVLAGAAAVTLVFGHLHGIALAFGVTVLGIALDYPLHLFVHHDRARSGGVRAVARELWPAIALGAASTMLVYALMALTDFSGMAQMGLFVLVGIAVAAATTRWVLPVLIPSHLQHAGMPLARVALPAWVLHPPRVARAGLGGLVLAAVAVIATTSPFPWEDDLAALSPIPEEQVALDRDLREALGLPDVRHALLVTAPTAEQALRASEALAPWLDALRAAGGLGHFDHPARVLPSQAAQHARQAALPEPGVLRERLARAGNGLGFSEGAFEPFVEDVARAREQALLEPEGLPDGLLRGALEPLLVPPEAGPSWMAWIRLGGVRDPQALSALPDPDALVGARLPAEASLRHVDFRQASEDLVTGFRDQALERLGIGLVAILVLLLLVTRAPRRSLRILAAVVSGLLLTVATLILLGVSLSLFHLIALLLVTGLCLDYAVFFSRPLADAAARRRNFVSVFVCALSTLVVFGLLGLSSLPVLQAMGLTVVPGVVFSLLAAALLAPARGAAAAGMRHPEP